MGDRSACGEHGIGGGGFDRGPLLKLGAFLGGGQDGVVGRGPIGVDVGEPAGDVSGSAYGPHGAGGSVDDACVQPREVAPGAGGFEGFS